MKKNKIILSLITAGLITSSLLAQDYVNKEDFEDSISELKEEINSMKTDNEEFQGDYSELENLVEELETKSLTDKIKWSGEMKTRMDNFRYNSKIIRNTPIQPGDEDLANNRGELNPDGTPPAGYSGKNFNKKWKPHYYFRTRLNLKTEVVKDLNFTGRMVISKNTDNNERICILSRDITASSTQKTTAFDLDKAYFDYFFNKKGKVPLIFSAGILPTTGGLSSNLKEGTKRKSVFPSIIFDMNVMGGIVSGKLDKITGLDNSWVRFLAGKGYTLNQDEYYYQCNRETVENIDVVGLFFETSLPFEGFKDSTVYAGINYLSGIKMTPYLGASSATADIKHAKSMGEIINLATGAELRNIKNSNLDLFIHLGMSKPNPSGETLNFSTFSTDSYASGKLIDKNGYSVYLGTRYTIEKLNNAQVGLEYNHGSKYWFSATQGAEDPYNKLATRGHVYELYYTQPLTKNFNIRAGYFQIQEDYTGSGWHFGTPAKKEGKQDNMYLELNVKF